MAKKLCRVDDLLPVDLWVDILSKLSVKSLLCCRCVCKTWHRIIGSTSFVETHLAYQNSSSNTNKYICRNNGKSIQLLTDCESVFFDTEDPKLYYTPLSFGKYTDFKVHGICNGLFCLSSDCVDSTEILLLHLWNPVCRKVKNLPQLIISNRKSVPSVSFGHYDDDYKVVVISLGKKTNTEVCVYSLKTNCWKIIPTTNVFGKRLYHIRDIHFNKFVHSTAYMLISTEPGVSYSVVCFSLSDETIQVIDFPEEFDSSEGFFNMEAYGDTIAIIRTCCRSDCQSLNMWILRSKATSFWEKKFGIEWLDGRSHSNPVGFLSNGKYLVCTCKLADHITPTEYKLWWCDLECPKLTEFQPHIQLIPRDAYQLLELDACVSSNCLESLLLLNEYSLDPFVYTETESSCSSSCSMEFIYSI